jgi:hypothetical protein
MVANFFFKSFLASSFKGAARRSNPLSICFLLIVNLKRKKQAQGLFSDC